MASCLENDCFRKKTHKKDLFAFERAQKETFTQLIKSDLEELKNIKVSLEMKIEFKKENEEGEIQYIENYFREDQPEVFSINDDENKIKGYFEGTFEKINNKLDQWVKEGSGWEVEKIELVYVNIARFQPLRGGTYLPLPEKLKNKKVIIDVENEDNECLKWALRSDLFPPTGRKKFNQAKLLPSQRRY